MEHRALLVVPDRGTRAALRLLLEQHGVAVRTAPDAFAALGALDEWPATVLVGSPSTAGMDGMAFLDKIVARDPRVHFVALTKAGDVATAVRAVQRGAAGCIPDPMDPSQAWETIAAALRTESAVETASVGTTRLLGSSGATAALREIIHQVAPSRASVLITGESGTGKELVARMLHEQSNRARGRFVRLHCAALSESLLESELFGHERGAFTGATARRRGRFEDADGGSLFLDEIGEISPSIQVKLLRFLQEREFERVGGNETLRVDVRVIAASNRALKAEVRAGRFRQDLFYRLNVIHLETTPLRARREDIPLLAHHFVARFAAENDKEVVISPEALGALQGCEWEGNVRELENVIERAVILARDLIELRHLPADLGDNDAHSTVRVPGSTLSEIERDAILRTLEAARGSTARTADILGISVRKVRYKLREYGIRRAPGE